MTRVVGIGNALVDVIVKLKDDSLLDKFSLPKGSMQLVDKEFAEKIENAAKESDIKLTSGGSAANTIHGLSSLGIDTGFIGKTGNDSHGHFFLTDMQTAGINPFLPFGKAETGRAISLVTPDSERTFATYLGSAIELSPADLDKKFLEGYSIFHIEGYLVQNHELVETALKMAKNLNMKISLDLASYNVVEANLDFLTTMTEKYIDFLFANEEEAKAFTGKNPEQAVKEIASKCDIAIVKTGKSGSLVQQGAQKYSIGVINARSIDTTGAGDLYAAGFLYGLAKNLSLDKCGNLGALLAGNVIEVLITGGKISW